MNKTSQPIHKPSICFVSLNAYNLLSERKDVKHIGGAEVQQVRIASWLVRHGYSVSFVTLDHGQPDGVNINGIEVFKAYAKDHGIRALRFLHPRWSGLWSAMKRANADVYYQRCAGCETGQVAIWCSLNRRKFIFAAANESDCDPNHLLSLPRIERKLYHKGIQSADTIIAQTETQQEMFRENLNVSTVLTRNCGWKYLGSVDNEPIANKESYSGRVLWVSRIKRHKRLEWLLDVAEQCPNILFDVIGGASTDSDYISRLFSRASQMSNVEMYGYVPYSEMQHYYQKSHILCCTSAYEGFPNSFLEAWSFGIPVISTFDPDGVIAQYHLGWSADNVEDIVNALKESMSNSSMWQKASIAAKQFYRKNHSPEVCLPQFQKVLHDVFNTESNASL